MESIWAPWRSAYVLGAKPSGCIFCQKPQEHDDRSSLIVYRGELNFVVLNLFPYNPGHLMVTPFRHVGRVDQLSDAEANELFSLVRKSTSVLETAISPHGFNVGMNLGRVAGAGVEDHVHMHLVPRWNGDTNFMPIVAQAKVVSEGLDAIYQKLKPVFDNLGTA